MNNKSLAWIEAYNRGFNDCLAKGLNPVKEITDAEIQKISHRYHYTYNPDYIGFARAILRKAQEK